MSCRCKPADFDEDLTHQVRYTQRSYRDSKVEWEDSDSELSCSHNDALHQAEIMAGRFSTCLKPRGKRGTWMGSDITYGDGEKVTVWVSRGPGEEEYDRNRRRADDSHAAGDA